MKAKKGWNNCFYEKSGGMTGTRCVPLIEYELDTAGLAEGGSLIFNPGNSHCGHIKDGVELSLGKGCFVLAMSDLKLMYIMAIEHRGGFPLPRDAKERE